MAELIRKDDKAPQPKKSGAVKAGLMFLLLAAVFGLIAAITDIFVFIGGSVASVVISVLIFCVHLSDGLNGKAAKRYGIIGERQAGVILQKYLPEEYTVIQNAVITYGGRTSEIDNIVVGRTGVFVIEVKYVKGSITGNYEWKNWRQHKVDQYGIAHSKEFYSPVKQVGTHVFRLANYLRDNKVFTHVSGVVYFANSETHVTLGGSGNIPVYSFSTTQDMLNYIKDGTADLSAKTVNKTIKLICNN
ncbi:MAG: NERD domain-containing protein [Ruminococcaceae bacterium]|nr:NERD domain-containing protein [Oscillospiraceae bacterium]